MKVIYLSILTLFIHLISNISTAQNSAIYFGPIRERDGSLVNISTSDLNEFHKGFTSCFKDFTWKVWTHNQIEKQFIWEGPSFSKYFLASDSASILFSAFIGGMVNESEKNIITKGNLDVEYLTLFFRSIPNTHSIFMVFQPDSTSDWSQKGLYKKVNNPKPGKLVITIHPGKRSTIDDSIGEFIDGVRYQYRFKEEIDLNGDRYISVREWVNWLLIDQKNRGNIVSVFQITQESDRNIGKVQSE